MSRVDQFESIFRSATKEVYQYQDIGMEKLLVVTDKNQTDSEQFSSIIKKFLHALTAKHELTWELLNGDDFTSSADLLEQVGKRSPDLICTYRNLHSKAWQFPHSLGTHLDVLLQQTSKPVLVLPHPDAEYAAGHALENTDVVMAITNHLAADHSLIDYAALVTEPGGTLYLSHIEDNLIFERYMEAIAKIDTIDTNNAQQRLAEQLLKEPQDYADSCSKALAATDRHLRVESMVSFGHSLSDYKRYIEEYKIDLLVMHAKDHDQLAMHGLAYPLAIELREIPLLMI